MNAFFEFLGDIFSKHIGSILIFVLGWIPFYGLKIAFDFLLIRGRIFIYIYLWRWISGVDGLINKISKNQIVNALQVEEITKKINNKISYCERKLNELPESFWYKLFFTQDMLLQETEKAYKVAISKLESDLMFLSTMSLDLQTKSMAYLYINENYNIPDKVVYGFFLGRIMSMEIFELRSTLYALKSSKRRTSIEEINLFNQKINDSNFHANKSEKEEAKKLLSQLESNIVSLN